MKNLDKNKIFWSENTKPTQKSKYIISASGLSDWLENNDYYLISNFGEPQIVQLVNNIAFIKTPMDVYNDSLKFIKTQENDTLRNCFILQGENLLISKKVILGALAKISINRYKDTNKVVRIFYSNQIVKVTDNSIKLEKYKKFKKLNKYVFSDQIIQRNFKLIDYKICDFEKFLKFATDDDYHFKSILTSIGFLISSHKNPSLAKAVILTDILSQVKNEAYGRSGKGLIIKAIAEIINVVEYNGKVTDLTNDKFVFQNVTIITSLIVLQDITKGFNFESLFSTLTDSMSIERKHRLKVNIPYSDSPKVVLTTNYTIAQDADSFKDRKHVIALNNFFNASNKPDAHFKRLLFDWSLNEWLRFDNFMVICVQQFLINGLTIYENPKLIVRKLINETSQRFIDLMNSEYNNLNEYFSLKKVAEVLEVGTNEPSAKSRIVSKWIEHYAAFKGYKIDKRQSCGITKICFKK